MKRKLLLIFAVLTISTNFITSFSKYASLLEAALDDYNKGQYSFAVNSLLRFIQMEEDTKDKPKAYYYVALSYYYLESYPLSLHYFNELEKKFKLSLYNTKSHFWKGSETFCQVLLRNIERNILTLDTIGLEPVAMQFG